MKKIKDCYRLLKTGEIVEHGNFFIEKGWMFLETNNISLMSINNIISKQESSINKKICVRSMNCYKRVKP